jgi:hypothetical protein
MEKLYGWPRDMALEVEVGLATVVALGSIATGKAYAPPLRTTMIAPTAAVVVALIDSSTPRKAHTWIVMLLTEYDRHPLDGAEKLDGSTMVEFKPVLLAALRSEVKAPTPAKKDTVGKDARGPGSLKPLWKETLSTECPEVSPLIPAP